MKVKDLIADSIWLPNARTDASTRPALSILMPTYCRGRDGLFQRAVRSLLEQALPDFELIIVDDGSTDGTYDQIQRVMAEDPRVHCIRHPVNIGLPAVSIFEAYQRARADYIGFAFDDDVAMRDGFAGLLEYATAHDSACVHGYASYRYGGSPPDGTSHLVELGRRDAAGRYPIPEAWLPPAGYEGSDARCLWKLHSLNLVGNMAVLLHRRVIEAVGLYDPHVLLVRACDWDLWKRVAARFPIDYCDVHTSIENGDQRSDALNCLYAIDFERVVEYSRRPRDHQLVPSQFPEFDVWATPEGADARLAAYAERVRQQMRRRGTPRQLEGAAEEDRKVVLLYDQGPATHLLLHALPPDVRRQFHVHHARTDWDALWPVLIDASAVIVCGDADRFARLGIAAEIRELEIPFYFHPAGHPVPGNLAELVPNLQGLVVTTEAGAQEAHALGLGDVAIYWPLSVDVDAVNEARLSAPTSDRTIVSVVGGDSGIASALAALAEIDRRGTVRLRVHARCAAGAEHRQPESPTPGHTLEIVPVPDERGWPQIVAKWRRHGIHLLLVMPGSSTETSFDGDAAVLLAVLIGAVPMVIEAPDAPRAHADADVIHIADLGGLEQIAIDLREADRRTAAYERARAYCRARTAAGPVLAAARQLLNRTAPVDVLLAEERWRRLERLRTRTIVAQHEQIQQWRARCDELQRTVEKLER